MSTNEVFDGRRADRQGYTPTDAPNPMNTYGASKLDGETLAGGVPTRRRPGAPRDRSHVVALRATGRRLSDQDRRRGQRRQRRGESLRVVDDEFGSPTFTADLAMAIVPLIEAGVPAGVHHCTNEGTASRLEWAQLIRAPPGDR